MMSAVSEFFLWFGAAWLTSCSYTKKNFRHLIFFLRFVLKRIYYYQKKLLQNFIFKFCRMCSFYENNFFLVWKKTEIVLCGKQYTDGIYHVKKCFPGHYSLVVIESFGNFFEKNVLTCLCSLFYNVGWQKLFQNELDSMFYALQSKSILWKGNDFI